MTIKLNDRVYIYNSKFDGTPTLEGQAIVVGRGMVPDQFMVLFDNDRTKYARFVYEGECQTDPQAFLNKLLAERERGGW